MEPGLGTGEPPAAHGAQNENVDTLMWAPPALAQQDEWGGGLVLPTPGLQPQEPWEPALQVQQGPWHATAQQQAQPAVWVPQTDAGGGGSSSGDMPDFPQGGSVAPDGMPMPWPLGGGRLDPATMAAKLSTAREKNRLAQQRFRERQRAKQKEAGEQCEVLEQEMEQLKIDNELLQRQNRIYEKVLVVRDAMLHTLATLHSAQQREHQQEQQTAAARGLARALDELPSEREMEDAAKATAIAGTTGSSQKQQQQQQAQQQQQQAQQAQALQAQQQLIHASSSSCPSSGASAVQEPPRWNLADLHRAGTAAQLDGAVLKRVESIPPASDEVVKAEVMAMAEPEQLLDYYRQWQVELSATYMAAEAAGFDTPCVAEVEAVQERMAKVWWHVGHLKPSYLSYLAHAALPEDSGRFPLWREIAERLMPQLSENSRATLRRCWYAYSKEMAKIGVKVSRWVKRLQEYAVLPVEAMASTAGHSMELVEITNHLCAAVNEEYTASMEFIAEQSRATTELQKALINKESAPFMPDIVAIVWNVLCLDAEQRSARSAVQQQQQQREGQERGVKEEEQQPSAGKAADGTG